MLFHQSSHLKSFLALMGTHIKHSLTAVLVAGLLGVHLTLLAVATFCASTAIHPDPSHHPDHASSTSILCAWACHVGQIPASASPTNIFPSIPILMVLWKLTPSTLPSSFRSYVFTSPRGPPLL